MWFSGNTNVIFGWDALRFLNKHLVGREHLFLNHLPRFIINRKDEGVTRLHEPKAVSLKNIARALSLVLAPMMLGAIALAQEPDPSSQQPQPAPIERADELKSKVTFVVYYVPNEVT